MKKIFSVLLAGFISMITIWSGYAQKSGDVLLPVRYAGSEAAATRATGQFWKAFGESKAEKWYGLRNGFLAEFSEKTVQVKVRSLKFWGG